MSLGTDLHEPVLAWFGEHARDLPWRRPDRTPWGVLVSEVMLQQTPVARVLPVWRGWLARWPVPAALAADPPGEAVRAWGRLGYPRRALRLHGAAVTVTERHGGAVPVDLEALRALPGVGQYTAAAVAAFAFGTRTPVVDTNVRRVLARAVSAAALPPPSLTAAELALAARVLPQGEPEAASWNAAVMELGALVCRARAPRCDACPLADRCGWRLAGRPPYDGPARRAQAWHGTDRQCRGVVLEALRGSAAVLGRGELAARWPDAAQLDRCLAQLVADGLLEPGAHGYALPGLTPASAAGRAPGRRRRGGHPPPRPAPGPAGPAPPR